MADMETRVERIPVPIPPKLVVTTADGSTEFVLSGPELTFGRGEDNDIVTTADAVSRHHASLELREDGVLIKDLGSTNGIAVDSNLVPEALLGPDNEVTIGTSVTLTYLPAQSVADQLAAMLEAPVAASAAPAEAGDASDEAEDVTASMPEADVVETEAEPEPAAADVVAVEAEAEAAVVVVEAEAEADVVVVEAEPEADVVVVEAEPEAAAEAVPEAAAAEPEPQPEVVAIEEEPAPQPEAAAAAAVAAPAAAAQSTWYVARAQGEPAWEGGPYAWEEVVLLAADGRLTEAEYIWYESSQTWVPAGQVPDLLPQPATPAVPAAAAVVLTLESAPAEVAAEEAAEEAAPFLRPAAAVPDGSAAPPAEEPASQGWYLSCSGSEGRIGPCAWDDLLALGRDGAIHAGDFVWHESLVEWLPVEQLPELAQHLRQEAVPEVAVVVEAAVPEVEADAGPAAPEVVVEEAPAPDVLATTQVAEPWQAPAATWESPAAATPEAAVAEEAAPATDAAAAAAAAGATDMSTGWFMSRGEGATAWQGGPYSWEELVGFALEGRLGAEDLVWHEGYAGWVSPAQVPGLPHTTGASW